MLVRLTIENYALIESLDIELPNGLIIITGETGAGKSILLGALSLLLGGRSDTSAIKDSTRNCVVEGEFDISGCDIDLSSLYDDIDGQESDGRLILRRVISPSGRSRAFLNDEPIPLSSLGGISRKLIDIHAQHEHLLLTDASYQLSVLDHYAGTRPLLMEYREVWNRLAELKASLKRVEEENRNAMQEQEYKEFQLAKLEEAALVAGEFEELEIEQKQLANAEEIRESVTSALELFHPMGNSIVQNFKEAVHLLRKCYTFVPGFEELAERVESCRIECKDIEQELEAKIADIVVSPERLEWVDERIALIEGLKRRYNCATVEELMEYRDSLKAELSGRERNLEEEQNLRAEVEKVTIERDELAKELSSRRASKVGELSELLKSRIRGLEMPYSEFKVELAQSGSYTKDGCDNISFTFAANGDGKLVEISKVASGGELSRIMLSLKSLMAKFTGMPTMIFDEIDTGVSGSIADKMGEVIGEMGKSMQVFAITHLPQIAVKGKTHLLVYKEFDENRQARSNIKMLEGDERVKEIARMLSGSELSQAAIENAKYLLSNN